MRKTLQNLCLPLALLVFLAVGLWGCMRPVSVEGTPRSTLVSSSPSFLSPTPMGSPTGTPSESLVPAFLNGDAIQTPTIICSDIVARYQTESSAHSLAFEGDGTLHGVGWRETTRARIFSATIRWTLQSDTLVEQAYPAPRVLPCKGACEAAVLAQSPTDEWQLVAVEDAAPESGIWLTKEGASIAVYEYMPDTIIYPPFGSDSGRVSVPWGNNTVWSDDGSLLWYQYSGTEYGDYDLLIRFESGTPFISVWDAFPTADPTLFTTIVSPTRKIAYIVASSQPKELHLFDLSVDPPAPIASYRHDDLNRLVLIGWDSGLQDPYFGIAEEAGMRVVGVSTKQVYLLPPATVAEMGFYVTLGNTDYYPAGDVALARSLDGRHLAFWRFNSLVVLDCHPTL